MADNFDLQGWMREQKQGPYADVNGVEKMAFTSSKPKSKTGLNEGLMGMIDLQPINTINEDMEDDMDAPEIEDTWYSDDTEDTMDSMPMDGTDTSFDKIQAGLISVQNKMNSLLAGFKAGSVSKDEYVAKRKMLQGMRDKLEAQLSISDDYLEGMEEDI